MLKHCTADDGTIISLLLLPEPLAVLFPAHPPEEFSTHVRTMLPF